MSDEAFGCFAWLAGIGMLASGLGYGGCQAYEALRPEKPRQEGYVTVISDEPPDKNYRICSFESQEARELAESALRPKKLVLCLDRLAVMDSDNDSIITEDEVINYVRKRASF